MGGTIRQGRTRDGGTFATAGPGGADGVADAGGDPVGVEADLGELLLRVAWAIRRSGMPEAGEVVGRQVVGDGVFEDGGAEAVLQAWSSTVSTGCPGRRTRASISPSSGLQKRASMTPTDTPSLASSSAASIACCASAP